MQPGARRTPDYTMTLVFVAVLAIFVLVLKLLFQSSIGDVGLDWWESNRVSPERARLVDSIGAAATNGGGTGSSAAPAGDRGPDWAVPGGRLFTQASGQPGLGYVVHDDADARLWTEFQRLGGIGALGYPISQRFTWEGAVTQAFQKGILQWRPAVGGAVPANTMDILHERGFDPWLAQKGYAPPVADWSGDTGRSWENVKIRHLALLTDRQIKAAFEAVPDPIDRFGLPMAPIQDRGNVLILRTQRTVLQKWTVDTPWATAGQVVVANAGEWVREAQLLPPEALTPVGDGAAPAR